ncbi:MAG TPA: hypothetical protein VFV67_36315 [Actinophytocola sp.]|uniref:hypothetical protein n=1 Tax=Actinophytocola sp. TaxID=1872138 RepID=UPI002DB5793A|nr:hypothetical protein [Actinophytocola sp.]HEU5476123.1 hypothetical protein [Actinophytocola sp.]
MDKLNRRNVLVTGGALGALGALSIATPAAARPPWKWKATGSVAGTGSEVDPRWQQLVGGQQAAARLGVVGQAGRECGAVGLPAHGVAFLAELDEALVGVEGGVA